MDKMKELYEKVAQDSALQAKFNAILSEAEKAEEEATEEKLVAFAKEAGFDVTVEEMKDFFKKLAERNEGELSEVELDMVAGGKGGFGALVSIIGLGFGCGVASAIGEAFDKGGCKDIMGMDIVVE